MTIMKLLRTSAFALILAFCFAFTAAEAQQKKPRTLTDVYSDGVKLYEAQRYPEAMKYFQYVKTKNPRDPRNMRYLNLTELAIKEGRTAKVDLEATLKSITIPEVDFQGASLGDVLAYIAQRAEELSDGKQSANFIYKGTAEQRANTEITLKLRNAPVTEVIRYVGSLSQTTFKFEEHAIVGTPLIAQSPTTTAPIQNASGFEKSTVNPLPNNAPAPDPFK